MKELDILYAALREAIRAGRFEEARIIQCGAIRLHDIAPELDTEKQVAICAWCLREQGIAAQPGDSHGICEHHAAVISAQSQARRAARLAKVA